MIFFNGLNGGLVLGLGSDGAFILDVGAIEYLYTDTAFASASHETYIGVQYEAAYMKYYFGEEKARYLEIGASFNIFGDAELLLHFGEVFETT